MKITKRQLRRIIKEEKRKLTEGWDQEEMELIDLITDNLIQAGAIGTIGDDYDGEPDYADAAKYLQTAVIPALESFAASQADSIREAVALQESQSPLGTDEEIANKLIKKGKFTFKQKAAVIRGLAKLHHSYKQRLSDVESNVTVGY